ncbi:GEVED domain-containing protein [Shewanella marina]|uniref:GEVED domain-containing protein n=1 Tax=Shewanella marina TaxID=487319 RepID=UPI00046F49E0|nr:GEVED domain-containing protein [Shewanella marina]
MTTNDGARCRYAPLGLDFGDAPDDFDTTNNAGGPFHVTRNSEIWIGTLPPDNDVNGAPTVTADGDDLIGTTPDDEDAFDNQVRVFINSGAGQISLPITNNSGKAATLYAWVDFDQSNSFDSDERANIAIAATDINSDMTLTWSGLTGVVTGDTYLRLRICTDDATVDCNQPIGIASNGEVEDHLAKVIEGVFPNNTCDGMYQVDSDSANSFDFSATLTSSLPYLQSSILTAQTGFDNLNAIAFDRVGGVFYGSFFDSSDNLHIAMFDKTGNIVDLGMPVASADFNIVNAATGGITSILTGNPVVASADLIGQLGTISGDGQYFYLGDADSAQLLVINLSTFTVDAVNLRLPDIGMSTGGGFALPFDSDWVYDATTGLIYVTELVARTLYNINPDTGAIGTSAIDFRTTIPNAQTYGIVMGQDSFAYLMVDGEYDSDLNGSLDTNGTALYQLNILSKKAQLLGQLNGANASFSDAAGCMVGALDYGDAATGYGDVSHQFFDNDANGITDYQLGMVWDSEFFAHVSANARDDNLYTLADEDGLLLNDALVAGSNDITIDVSQTAVLNMWLDYQQGGSFEASEQLLTNYAVSAGSNNISVNLDSAAMGSYNGVTTLRIRICEQAGQCDQATDVNQGGSAVNGEVEDYQVWTSSAAIVNQTCNSATLSYGQTGSYGLLDLQTQTDPFTTGVLQQPVAIAGLTTFDGLSGLGIHPQSYLVYGIAMDTSTADNPIHLWVTDQTGTQLVDLGVVVSALHQSMNHNSQGVVNFVINQPLSQMVAGANIDSATRGAIDPSGEYLYLHNEQWQQLIRVYIRDLTFTIVSMDSALTAMGGDMAFSSSGSLYNPDLVAGQLYQLQPETGAINTLALNWNGIASVQSGGQSAGVFMDTGIFLYAISYHGIHDLDRDGTAEYHGSVMYQINTVNGDIAPMVAMDESYTDELDAAGCFVSADHGDSTFVNDGAASHGFYDSDGDGYADFRLGSQLDVEPKQSLSTDASGDDLLYLDDEDGVVMPISMVVNQLETIDVEVTSQTGTTLKLNVWVDLNGNGSYRDSGEQIVNEQDVSHGTNSVDLLLAAAYTSGFNGDTTMRFRLCEQANQCNKSDDIELAGVAVNGEVEDYQFNLINQIVLRGQVFEDNGMGSGVAHDGKLNGTEAGIAGFEVKAVYEGAAIAGYNIGDIIGITRTLANGRFEITLPVEVAHQDIFLKVVNQAQWIDISESDTAGYSQITNTSVIDHLMIINAAAGDSLTNLDFGKVKAPTLTPDNFTEAEPGIAVTMSHKLDTYTAGVINFSQVNEISAPINNDWSNALFRDHNCDGILDDNDLAITSISVSGVMSVCLISEVYIPINATINSTYQYDVTAQMVFEDSMSSGHSVIRTAKSQDALRVTYRGAGQLKLEKVVRNISQSGSDGVQNSAKPGDILQYTIKFTNTGSGDITNINIHDDTPIFTKLYQAIDCASMIIPSSLTCTIVTPNGSNDVGYIGFITWQLTGTLMSGASGQIIYQVEVE